MEADRSDEDDDDFSRHLKIMFPAMIFENLQVEDDAELLRPIVEAIYALSLSEDSTFSLVSFDTIKSNVAKKEYTLTANIRQDTRIYKHAWDALLTVSPTRVLSVIAEPYYDNFKGVAMMRVRVTVGSMLGPLRKSYVAYARRVRSITYSTLNRAIKQTASNNEVEAGRADTDILNPREKALTQIYEARRSGVREMIHDLREECRRLVPQNRSLDMSGPSIVVDSQRNVVSWNLPPDAAFNVDGLSDIIEKFNHLILNTSICVKTELSVDAGAGTSGAITLVSLVIDFDIVPYHALDVAITDSKTYLYMNEKRSAKNDDKLWRLSVDTDDQLYAQQHRPNLTDKTSRRAPSKSGSKTVQRKSTFAMATRSSASSAPKEQNEVISLSGRVPKPSSLKRRRPFHLDDDETAAIAKPDMTDVAFEQEKSASIAATQSLASDGELEETHPAKKRRVDNDTNPTSPTEIEASIPTSIFGWNPMEVNEHAVRDKNASIDSSMSVEDADQSDAEVHAQAPLQTQSFLSRFYNGLRNVWKQQH